MATRPLSSPLKSSDPGFDELLSRYLDDELPAAQAQQVEACLEQDPEAVQAFERLLMARELLRQSYQSEVNRVDFGAMWQNIEAGIAPIQHAPVPVRATSVGLLDRLMAWWSSLGWAPVGVGAVAAILLTVVVTQPSQNGSQNGIDDGTGGNAGGEVARIDGTGGAVSQPPGADGTGSGVQPDAVPPADASAVSVAVITEGTEVNDVSGGQDATVMVFHSPENATIIWVNESEG